jgi:hypothetical protein
MWEEAAVICFKVTFPPFGPPLCSSGQSAWQQICKSRFDSRRYKIFWEVVGLERGPLSLISTIEELLERKIGGSGLENRYYGCGDLLCWQNNKLALTSPTGGGSSVGIVHSQTEGMEIVLFCCLFPPFSRTNWANIHCWLHCSALTLAIVYSWYIWTHWSM